MPPTTTLLAEATCPHCWERFQPEQVLWISEHVRLMGDPMLGDVQQKRFPPSRFTWEGNALDEMGVACTGLACPRCRLPLPRMLLEVDPLFVSILGAPSSGKSFFLASMTWQLRHELATRFAISFTDVDASLNRELNACEESLFLNGSPHEVVPLLGLIKKTEREGDLYNSVTYPGGQAVQYPRPFVFALRAQPQHPGQGEGARLTQALCVYDNAGEHFEPGQDTAASPTTRHVARSQLLLFLFDPTRDHRFRALCRHGQLAGAADPRDRLSRQEMIMNEAAARVRRFAGLSSTAKHDRPLIVVLTKSDEWAHLLDTPIPGEPWVRVREDGLYALSVESILERSQSIRRLMLKHCREFVAAAEDFASDVTYIAVSALGDRLEVDPKTEKLGIRPCNIQPSWVTVPMIYGLGRVASRLIPRVKPRPVGGTNGPHPKH
jgi:hypothetical protein